MFGRYSKIAGYLFVFAVLAHTIVGLYKIISTYAPDFFVYYDSAKQLANFFLSKGASGRYSGYPLIPTIFFLPLIIMPYKIAQLFFVLSSALSVVMIVYISLKTVLTRFSTFTFLFILALAFLSFPVKFTLGMGQINLISALFLVLGFWYYTRNQPIKAGIFLGLSIWTKPFVALIGLFYLTNVKKNWGLMFTAFILISSISILAVTLFGIENNNHYAKTASILLDFKGREIYYNQGFMGFVSRLTDNTNYRIWLSFIPGLFLLAIAFFKKNVPDKFRFSLFVIAALLFDPLSWQHHFVYLIFPFIIAYGYFKKTHDYRFLSLVILSYLLVSPNIKNPALYQGFPQVFVLSHLFYGSLILFITIATIRPEKINPVGGVRI